MKKKRGLTIFEVHLMIAVMYICLMFTEFCILLQGSAKEAADLPW